MESQLHRFIDNWTCKYEIDEILTFSSQVSKYTPSSTTSKILKTYFGVILTPLEPLKYLDPFNNL